MVLIFGEVGNYINSSCRMLGTNNSNLATIIFINIYGGMIMKKTEEAPIEYQWCNILRWEKIRSRMNPLLGSRGHGDCQIRRDNRWLQRFRMALTALYASDGKERNCWFDLAGFEVGIAMIGNGFEQWMRFRQSITSCWKIS